MPATPAFQRHSRVPARSYWWPLRAAIEPSNTRASEPQYGQHSRVSSHIPIFPQPAWKDRSLIRKRRPPSVPPWRPPRASTANSNHTANTRPSPMSIEDVGSVRFRWGRRAGRGRLDRAGSRTCRTRRTALRIRSFTRGAHPLSSSQCGDFTDVRTAPGGATAREEAVFHRAHPAAGEAGARAPGGEGAQGGATAPDHRRGQAVGRAPRPRRPHRGGHEVPDGSPGDRLAGHRHRRRHDRRQRLGLHRAGRHPFRALGHPAGGVPRAPGDHPRPSRLSQAAVGGAGDRGGAPAPGLAPRRDREDEPPLARGESCGWRPSSGTTASSGC